MPRTFLVALSLGILAQLFPCAAGIIRPADAAPSAAERGEHHEDAPDRHRPDDGTVIEILWHAGGLAGTLSLPAQDSTVGGGAQPRVGVLILAGSGPTDRDGNGPGLQTDLYRQLAAALSRRGHVVLRYDKRGVGQSRAAAPHEADLRFSHLVDDAVLAMTDLAARDDVSGVVLLGHSEGGLIATLAMARVATTALPPTAPATGDPNRARGLILLAAPGRPLDQIIRAQLAAAGLPAPLQEEAGAVLDALRRGETGVAAPEGLDALFRPSVQPYLASQIAIDPAAALAKIDSPILLVQGDRDLQVGAEDLDRLAAAAPKARVLRLERVNHIMRAAPADRAGNLALYARPDAPLAPELVPALQDFLDALD